MNRYRINDEELKIGSKVKLSHRFWLAYKMHSENDTIARNGRGEIIGEETESPNRWMVKWNSEDMESIAGLYVKRAHLVRYE